MIDGAICFFAHHRAAMLCSRYVFLDVVRSTSGNAKISRTNATIRIVISFFWRFNKIPSFLVLFFKCLISAPSIWSRCRGGRSHFQILFFQTFTKNSRTAHMWFTAMAAAVMPNAFLSNVLIGLNDPMLLFLSNHKIRSWKQSSISWPQDLPTSFLSRVLTG